MMETKVQVPVDDPAAHAVMERAHKVGYRYPTGFAGFQARFDSTQGDVALSGTVTVRAPQDIVVETSGQEEGRSWIHQELTSMAGHRWNVPYQEADGRHVLTLESSEHPLGDLIRVQDRFNSFYRVREGEITQVSREIGPHRFSIFMQERVAAPDGRTLPVHFTVVFWRTQDGQVTKTNIFSDRYQAVAGVFLPACRRVISVDGSGLTVREFRLSDHQFLDSSESLVSQSHVNDTSHGQAHENGS